MPVMNGVEATRAIRSDSLNRDAPILAMTANAFDEDRQVCLTAGMNDHIGKPVVQMAGLWKGCAAAVGRYAQVSVMNSFDPGHARDLWWHCESEH
jgi:CheY-like chemotaxis protein